MAHVLVYHNPGQPTNQRYNVDAPVGRSPTSQNRRTDVMLVQALLRIFFYELDGASEFGSRFDPPSGYSQAGDLVVDGYHGPVTQKHIDAFLDQLAKAEPAAGRRNDHGLDPMNRMVVSGKRAFVVGLVMLNDFCFDLNLRSMPLEVRAISSPELVPPLLATALTRRVVFH